MFLVAAVPGPHAKWVAIGFLPLALLVHRARLSPFAFMKRVAKLLPFVLGIVTLALVRGDGLSSGLGLAVKSTLSVAVLQLFALTTPFHEALATLRKLGLPKTLLLALALLHRYLHVAVEETQRLRRARKARTWAQGNRTAWRASSSVIACAFVRSTARAERVSRAMLARGGP